MIAALGAAGGSALLALVLTGALDAATAVQLALAFAALGLLGMNLLAVRRADGKVLRLDRKVVALNQRFEPARADIRGLRSDLARLTAAVDRLDTSVRQVETRTATSATSILGALGEDRIEAMSRSSAHAGLLLEIGSELRERVAPAIYRLSRELDPGPDEDPGVRGGRHG
ncbi:hypothetical protein HS041_11085 [Planomonospora sp. ID67723]|uniref:hypothetical protein n=1 Tax=Planomonospora sp. ID67723 TaxID=2738134 RepID=UPI0018C41693|nr:hypothetical protein [Planomonospora sp. ID67723]MBG0828308.1 hypothetical protein [Planomonospora sp. ID67723]